MKLSLQAKANILKVVALAIFIFIMYSVSGCSSSCSRTKRYWRNHRCVQVQPKDTTAQFVVVNNEIIMLR